MALLLLLGKNVCQTSMLVKAISLLVPSIDTGLLYPITNVAMLADELRIKTAIFLFLANSYLFVCAHLLKVMLVQGNENSCCIMNIAFISLFQLSQLQHTEV